MSEKLVLPNPAPKGIEHEKWKAMVDSVIEFIAASRTMLQILNERLKDNEKMRKVEEEKVKLEFYEDFLNSKLNGEQNSKIAPNLSSENQDSGDTNTEKGQDGSFSNLGRLNDSILNRHGKKFISRIPRTKSCMEERNKSLSMERPLNEGTLGKCCRGRKTMEIGYSTIHQRSKTPKGDGNCRA